MDPFAFAEFTFVNKLATLHQTDCSVLAIIGKFEVKQTAKFKEENLNGDWVKLNPIPKEDSKVAHNLACCNEVYIKPVGSMILFIESGGWTKISVPFIVVYGPKASLVEQKFRPFKGIRLPLGKLKNHNVQNIEPKPESDLIMANWVKHNNKGLCTRFRMSKEPMVKTTFAKDSKAIQ